MSDDRDFERAMGDWLADGSDTTPRPTVDAVLLAVKTTPQERDLRVPWRDSTMANQLRLVATIAVIAVVGVVGLNYLAPGTGPSVGVATATPAPTQSPTPTPEPSPTPSPTADTLDTSAWTDYTSDQYGFGLAHPGDWTVVPATRAWTYEADANDPVLSSAADHFESADRTVRVSAWTIPIDRDTLPDWATLPWSYVEGWVETYCPRTDIESCVGASDRAVSMCLEKADCHEGALLVPFDEEVQAFVVDYDNARMIVLSVWRGAADPVVAPYGGSRRLLEAFLSSMNVWPAP